MKMKMKTKATGIRSASAVAECTANDVGGSDWFCMPLALSVEDGSGDDNDDDDDDGDTVGCVYRSAKSLFLLRHS